MRYKANAERVYEPHARLIAARSRRYDSAEAAAAALGVAAPTYRAHENGSRGLGRIGPRYAKFFNVSLDWLVSGKGTMSGAPAIPVMGRIGAGAVVTEEHGAEELLLNDLIEMPNATEAQAYVVQGDSMRPRFFPGEILVFEKNPRRPADLIGQYCKVQLDQGDSPIFIKILRRGRSEGLWRLESHNADPMEDIVLRAAWPWLALLPSRKAA